MPKGSVLGDGGDGIVAAVARRISNPNLGSLRRERTFIVAYERLAEADSEADDLAALAVARRAHIAKEREALDGLRARFAKPANSAEPSESPVGGLEAGRGVGGGEGSACVQDCFIELGPEEAGRQGFVWPGTLPGVASGAPLPGPVPAFAGSIDHLDRVLTIPGYAHAIRLVERQRSDPERLEALARHALLAGRPGLVLDDRFIDAVIDSDAATANGDEWVRAQVSAKG